MSFQPVIKWSGSKRSQAIQIVDNFPSGIDTYYEPFVGGASVLYALLCSKRKAKSHVCSDVNKDLITLWNCIKADPIFLAESYSTMWHELNRNTDLNEKKNYFYSVRKRFNTTHKPEDFLFISRTTTNGLIRYNAKGEFNNSFHVTRKGINPDTLYLIILNWSSILNANNVKFIHQDYKDVHAARTDFIYADPPYAGTNGMYYGTINYDDVWDWLRKQPCRYALSFDGTCGDADRTFDVPVDVYNKHIYVYSGCSSFKRLKAMTTEYVQESLYLKEGCGKQWNY